MDLAVAVRRERLSGGISAFIRRFHVVLIPWILQADGLTTKAAIFEGTRYVVKGLKQQFPGVLAYRGTYPGALMSVVPVFQVF
jgi:hypothetical protein